jgi:protein-disulfide isomerase
MTRHMTAAATLAGLAAFAILPACSQGGSGSNRADMEKIVREYILANPELIEEALVALEQRAASDMQLARQAALAENRAKLFSLAGDYSVGPADAPVTVVEFFDYRCGFCKRSADWVASLPELYDGQVRVVFKELPVLDRGSDRMSETAALAALAAGRQGKYLEFHLALMNIESNSDLSDQALDRTAAGLGLDVARMRRDMASAEVRQQLADMRALGRALMFRGTPAFVVDDAFVDGADIQRIQQLIRDRLEG